MHITSIGVDLGKTNFHLVIFPNRVERVVHISCLTAAS
jgi:hypothetical protein